MLCSEGYFMEFQHRVTVITEGRTLEGTFLPDKSDKDTVAIELSKFATIFVPMETISFMLFIPFKPVLVEKEMQQTQTGF
jgi:hypothetical protein